MITIALAVIAITAILYYLITSIWNANQYWKGKGINYIKPLYVLKRNLQVIVFNKSQQEIVQEIYDAFPNDQVIGCFEFLKPRIFVRDGDLVQKILIKDFAHFMDHGIEIDVETSPLDEQLFFMNGNRWRAFRVKLSPIFTSGKLKDMFTTMTTCGHNLIDYIDTKGKDDFDIREMLGLFSMDIIGSAVFGMDPKTLKNPDCKFRKMGKKLTQPSISTFLRVWMVFIFPKIAKFFSIPLQDATVTKFFRDLIRNAFDYRKEKSLYRNDFIQLMMQLKEKGQIEVNNWDSNDDYLKTDRSGLSLEKFEITDDILFAQAQAFMLAGFEATAIFMTFTLFELSQNLDIQDKVREEILEQMKIHGEINYEALKNMKYLEGSIKEAERFYPIMPVLMRVCTKTYELSNGFVINKGDKISIPVSSIHMDPNYFPNPKVYDPSRFLEPVKPGTFLPFGEGPRICIAMRYTLLVMKYGLALILMNYRVKLSLKTKVPLKMNNRAFGPLPAEKILFNLEKL